MKANRKVLSAGKCLAAVLAILLCFSVFGLSGCKPEIEVPPPDLSLMERKPCMEIGNSHMYYLDDHGRFYIAALRDTMDESGEKPHHIDAQLTNEQISAIGGTVEASVNAGYMDGVCRLPILVDEDVLAFNIAMGQVCYLREDKTLYAYRINSGETGGPVKIAENVIRIFIDGSNMIFLLEDGRAVVYCEYDDAWRTAKGTGSFTDLEGESNYFTVPNVRWLERRGDNYLYIDFAGDLYYAGYNVYGLFADGKHDPIGYSEYDVARYENNSPIDPGYNTKAFHKVMSNVREAAFNDSNIFAVTFDNELYAWGNNEYGTVGNGKHGDFDGKTRDIVTKPVKVLDNVDSVTILSYAQGYHLFEHDKYLGRYIIQALTLSGEVYSWGYNTNGAVGNGEYATEYGEQLVVDRPVKVLEGAAEILLPGGSQDVNRGITSCVLMQDGSVYTWGYSVAGQTGTGVRADVHRGNSYMDAKQEHFMVTPTKILDNVHKIYQTAAAGSYAVTDSGEVYVWGANPLCFYTALDESQAGVLGLEVIDDPRLYHANPHIIDRPVLHPFAHAEIDTDGRVEIVFTPVLFDGVYGSAYSQRLKATS